MKSDPGLQKKGVRVKVNVSALVKARPKMYMLITLAYRTTNFSKAYPLSMYSKTPAIPIHVYMHLWGSKGCPCSQGDEGIYLREMCPVTHLSCKESDK